MTSGLFFIGANLAAGLFNYLFQVIASQQLTPQDFARLNSWFANLAVFFVIGGLLQYYSNFNPAKKKTLKLGIIAANILGLIFLVTWAWRPGPLSLHHSVIMVGCASMTGWLMGQAQIRLKFATMALTSLAVGLSRTGLTALPAPVGEEFDKFTLISFAVLLVPIWILSVTLWPAPDVKGKSQGRHWQGAIILSIATAIIPQFDMFLMSHTQADEKLVLFAFASLFGRAVFAVMSIFAQWLLPNQIQGRKLGENFKIWYTLAAVFLICALLALISPFVGESIFRWNTIPAPSLVFLASAEISVLAVIFVVIQSACAKGRLKLAATMLGVLGVEAASQLLCKFDMHSYLAVALGVQTVMAILSSSEAVDSERIGEQLQAADRGRTR